MTGRAAGFCAGYAAPGYMNALPGLGALRRGGFWGGGGRGRRNWYYATGLTRWQRAAAGYPAGGYSPAGYPQAYPPADVAPFGVAPTREQELEALKNQTTYFQEALESVNQRIRELETGENDA